MHGEPAHNMFLAAVRRPEGQPLSLYDGFGASSILLHRRAHRRCMRQLRTTPCTRSESATRPASVCVSLSMCPAGMPSPRDPMRQQVGVAALSRPSGLGAHGAPPNLPLCMRSQPDPSLKQAALREQCCETDVRVFTVAFCRTSPARSEHHCSPSTAFVGPSPCLTMLAASQTPTSCSAVCSTETRALIPRHPLLNAIDVSCFVPSAPAAQVKQTTLAPASCSGRTQAGPAPDAHESDTTSTRIRGRRAPSLTEQNEGTHLVLILT